MKVDNVTLEKRYHGAVEHWARHNFKDYQTLLENWDRYFPTDEPFCLCAKLELGTPELVQVGEHQGEKKRSTPASRAAMSRWVLMSTLSMHSALFCSMNPMPPMSAARLYTIDASRAADRHAGICCKSAQRFSTSGKS